MDAVRECIAQVCDTILAVVASPRALDRQPCKLDGRRPLDIRSNLGIEHAIDALELDQRSYTDAVALSCSRLLVSFGGADVVDLPAVELIRCVFDAQIDDKDPRVDAAAVLI